jgi:protein-tyrosine phosphatase
MTRMPSLHNRASPIANLRDFGGQRVDSNHRVRQNKLFRTGSLSALIPDDHILLDDLGIMAVIDLRSVEERANHPSEWVPANAVYVASPINDTKSMLRELFSGDIDDPETCRDHFSAFYAQIPELYAEEFSNMFALLAQGQVPLLVNCSAGKDRTGVAAALILSLLGVGKDAIFEDYLTTQDRLQNNAAFMQMLSGRIIKSYAALPKAAQNILMGVHTDHLIAAFAKIDADYGGVPAYLTQRLSVSPDQQEQIREILVERM